MCSVPNPIPNSSFVDARIDFLNHFSPTLAICCMQKSSLPIDLPKISELYRFKRFMHCVPKAKPGIRVLAKKLPTACHGLLFVASCIHDVQAFTRISIAVKISQVLDHLQCAVVELIKMNFNLSVFTCTVFAASCGGENPDGRVLSTLFSNCSIFCYLQSAQNFPRLIDMLLQNPDLPISFGNGIYDDPRDLRPSGMNQDLPVSVENSEYDSPREMLTGNTGNGDEGDYAAIGGVRK